ncbi:hypothetical protein Pelo_17085 [Pelomyxa schiedti]|nr:hypothetical protein Pelo_17085 [Pelomyxa schiedti]
MPTTHVLNLWDVAVALSGVLTPASLSLIGREVQRVSHNGDRDHPAVVDFGKKKRKFYGWVGPQSVGHRFPLLGTIDTQGIKCMKVIDLCAQHHHVNSSGKTSNVVAVVAGNRSTTCLQFLGDDSLVVQLDANKSSCALIVIDLMGTLEHKELRILWCWAGKWYTTMSRDSQLVCLTTGVKTALIGRGKGRGSRMSLDPIGGPDYALTEAYPTTEVYSVMAPNNMCFRHFPKGDEAHHIVFGNELGLREKGPLIQVIYAASGLILLTIDTLGRYFVFNVS